MDEIAERLTAIITANGPRSIASYWGTATMGSPLIEPFVNAFMTAIGSPMEFNPTTIDKPGRATALALHGRWMAPMQGYDRPDVALLIGANPFQSYYGVAAGNPATWLSERLRAGMQLIVVDPRLSDIAKRATLHLQPVPGEDPAILACLIRVIIDQGLFDQDFVDANATGLERLRAAVDPFVPAAVAARAHVAADDLVLAAHLFADAQRGYVACGVGPGFSSSSTLVEYLALNLETLCGHWLRAGERVMRSPTLMPSRQYKAQAASPQPATMPDPPLRIPGLRRSVAGMPTGVLADEMLTEGEGRVRALLSVAGNPASAWPDQLKVVEALRSLQLLVQIDPWMSATARLADYVIAPRMPYETAAATLITDLIIALPTFYGPEHSYGQYTDAVVEPPPGSDVVGEWEFFHGLAKRMDLSLTIRTMRVTDEGNPERMYVDMGRLASANELISDLTAGSRVPLRVVQSQPHGGTFSEPAEYVMEKDPGWAGRFDLANVEMLAELAIIANADPVYDDHFPFRLVCRRVQQVINSSLHDASTDRGRGYNPAWVHPDDLASLGIGSGNVVRVTSRRASILAIVEPDPTLRRGLVAMSHGYGDTPERDAEFRAIGSPTSRLLDNLDFTDTLVGMPRIGNIPVRLTLELAAHGQ